MHLETTGHHIIMELSQCRVDYLEDLDFIKKIMINSAEAAGAEVKGVATHKFSPQGVSCVVVIAESHMSIHTWPEAAYAALDIYTCGHRVLPQVACDKVAQALEAGEIHQSDITRGIPRDGSRFTHSVKTTK